MYAMIPVGKKVYICCKVIKEGYMKNWNFKLGKY